MSHIPPQKITILKIRSAPNWPLLSKFQNRDFQGGGIWDIKLWVLHLIQDLTKTNSKQRPLGDTMNLLYGSSKQGTQALFWANNQRLLSFWALFVPINPQYLCHKVTPGNEGLLPPALSNSAGISDWNKSAHRGDPTPEPTLKFSWKSWGHCGRARGGLKMCMLCPSYCIP